MWIQALLRELGYKIPIVPICGDNQGSIFIGSNPVQEHRSKHIDICYHYVRQLTEENSSLSKVQKILQTSLPRTCYDFSYFVLFTYVFSLFLEVSHGAATLTHFSLTHISTTLLTHSTAIVLTHSIAIFIVLPHWCSIYSGQSCRLFFS